MSDRYTNRVIFGDETIMDISNDTVGADTLLAGVTAHNKDGEPIVGECTYDADTKDADAEIEEVLYGKTYYKDGVKNTGTMTNVGTQEIEIVDLSTVSISQGYHDGDGFAKIADSETAKIIPSNIKKDVEILGVVGSHEGGGGGGGVPVQSLTIDTSNAKTVFNVGEYFNDNGLKVNAEVGGLAGDVTSVCVITPPTESAFTVDDIGYHGVPVDYYGTIKTYEIRVRQGVDIVPWATGTDKQIAEMLEAYYNDELDFSQIDGWDIGAERTVSLSAMSATGVSESHVAQNVTFVLMHKNGIDLTTPINGHSKCAFVVGMKDTLHYSTVQEYGYLNSVAIDNWSNCARRTWCNNVFKNAIPSTLRGCFKQFKNATNVNNNLITVDDYFSLNSAMELFGTSKGNWYPREGFQFDYYKTAENRYKYRRGYNESYWMRSFNQEGSYGQAYRKPNNEDAPNGWSCTFDFGISPFGVI